MARTTRRLLALLVSTTLARAAGAAETREHRPILTSIHRLPDNDRPSIATGYSREHRVGRVGAGIVDPDNLEGMRLRFQYEDESAMELLQGCAVAIDRHYNAQNRTRMRRRDRHRKDSAHHVCSAMKLAMGAMPRKRLPKTVDE